MTVKTVERDLAKALFRFSFGKLTEGQAQLKAKEVAPNFDLNDEMLMHKGVNWYAKQLLAAMGMQPTIEEIRSLALNVN